MADDDASSWVVAQSDKRERERETPHNVVVRSMIYIHIYSILGVLLLQSMCTSMLYTTVLPLPCITARKVYCMMIGETTHTHMHVFL